MRLVYVLNMSSSLNKDIIIIILLLLPKVLVYIRLCHDMPERLLTGMLIKPPYK